jgi:hypothetical protein
MRGTPIHTSRDLVLIEPASASADQPGSPAVTTTHARRLPGRARYCERRSTLLSGYATGGVAKPWERAATRRAEFDAQALS